MKYVREVSIGRRDGITLSHVLVFVTGASEEPVVGFVLHPVTASVKAKCYRASEKSYEIFSG